MTMVLGPSRPIGEVIPPPLSGEYVAKGLAVVGSHCLVPGAGDLGLERENPARGVAGNRRPHHLLIVDRSNYVPYAPGNKA